MDVGESAWFARPHVYEAASPNVLQIVRYRAAGVYLRLTIDPDIHIAASAIALSNGKVGVPQCSRRT
jgi:hypothetical protein